MSKVILAESGNSEIFHWDHKENNPLFRCVIDDYEYSFSVAGFSCGENNERYEWLVQVLDRHIQTICERTETRVRNEIGEQFQGLLGAINLVPNADFR